MTALSPIDAARIALACLDLTSLNDGDDEAVIAALCAKADGAAAVCVWPRFVKQARDTLASTIRVAAVANFPHGELDPARAVADAEAIVEAGGDEIDLVLPYRAFAAGERRASAALVAAVRRATPGRRLKLIIESGELRTPALIGDACRLGLDEGVDFLKTSTGKTPVSATPDAARTMLEAIAAHARGREAGFKASGGIRRVEDAAVYIALTRELLGDEALQPQRLRFGASGLLADLRAMLGATDAGAPASDGY
jgi:deoxyribose-phosphate aldolase